MTEIKWICEEREKYCVAKGCPHSISHIIEKDILCCEWDHCDTTDQIVRCIVVEF